MRIPFSVCLASGLFVAAIGPSSCQKKQAAAPTVEPPVVTVAEAVLHQVTDYVDYTGRIDAVNAVDVRARVTGYLEKMPFKEGDEVEKGALLFLIDERPYEAQLAQAEAQVQLNEAALKLARANNARAKNLSKNPGVITQQDMDQYQATEDQSRAQLEASKGGAGDLSAERRILSRDLADQRASQPLLLHRRQPGEPGPNFADHHRLARSDLRLFRLGRDHGAENQTRYQRRQI